jgi:serine/threonine protein kinase
VRDVGIEALAANAKCERNVTSNNAAQTMASSQGEKVRTLGRYSLIAEIGRGGMGVIYLALVRGPARFNKLFVVKELKPEFSEDPDVVSLFLEEARLSARMSHPNVAQTLEIGSQGERHFMAMEYLEGESLFQIRERCAETGTELPRQYALSIIVGALEGLHYAHTFTDFDGTAQGIVHRDVSPHNLFVTFDGNVKVLDFGIAKASDSSVQTETGVLKGKVAYMAPEQAFAHPVDARTDVFAVGVVLWEAIAGRRMWGESTADMTILQSLWSRQIPSLGSANGTGRSDIPPDLVRLVDKATAANPDDRYQTAAEMEHAIEAYLRAMQVAPFAPRDIGKFVLGLFKRDRAEIKARIDSQLKLIASVPWDETLSIGIARVHPGATPVGTSLVQPFPSGTMPVGTATDPTLSMRQGAAVTADATAARRPRTWPIAAVVAGAVALGAGGWLAARRSTPGSPAGTTSAPATSAPEARTLPPAPAAPVPSVRISVVTTPSSARLVVDGQSVGNSPFTGSFPMGPAEHVVGADAPGFAPARLEVPFDEDRTVNLVLRPLDPQAARPPSRSPGSATAPAPPSSPHTSRKKNDLEPF